MSDIATRQRHQWTASPEASAAAFHESGHAVAVVRAFRDARWLPSPPPQVLVRYVEIAEDSAGGWSGNCASANVYSVKWPIEVLAKPFRPLMEAQVTIELAGGIAEAIYCGERRAREVLAFATRHCNVDTDLERARAALGDLRRLTAYDFVAQDFAERTLALLLDNWRAVEALASVLIMNGRVEGEMVEAIIDCA